MQVREVSHSACGKIIMWELNFHNNMLIYRYTHSAVTSNFVGFHLEILECLWQLTQAARAFFAVVFEAAGALCQRPNAASV